MPHLCDLEPGRCGAQVLVGQGHCGGDGVGHHVVQGALHPLPRGLPDGDGAHGVLGQRGDGGEEVRLDRRGARLAGVSRLLPNAEVKIANLIDTGRAYARFDDGRVVFKAEVACATPYAARVRPTSSPRWRSPGGWSSWCRPARARTRSSRS